MSADGTVLGEVPVGATASGAHYLNQANDSLVSSLEAVPRDGLPPVIVVDSGRDNNFIEDGGEQQPDPQPTEPPTFVVDVTDGEVTPLSTEVRSVTLAAGQTLKLSAADLNNLSTGASALAATLVNAAAGVADAGVTVTGVAKESDLSGLADALKVTAELAPEVKSLHLKFPPDSENFGSVDNFVFSADAVKPFIAIPNDMLPGLTVANAHEISIADFDGTQDFNGLTAAGDPASIQFELLSDLDISGVGYDFSKVATIRLNGSNTATAAQLDGKLMAGDPFNAGSHTIPGSAGDQTIDLDKAPGSFIIDGGAGKNVIIQGDYIRAMTVIAKPGESTAARFDEVFNFTVDKAKLDLGYTLASSQLTPRAEAASFGSGDNQIAIDGNGLVTFDGATPPATLDAKIAAVLDLLAQDRVVAFEHDGDSYVVRSNGTAGTQDADVVVMLHGVNAADLGTWMGANTQV